MSNILYLVHRLPYPPNKGDKVRSYHLLKHLAGRHRVHLGCFVDDADDMSHLDEYRAALAPLCASIHIQPLKPGLARLASLTGLLTHEALTLPYYRSAALTAWVDERLATQDIEAAVIFSSAMAQYVIGKSAAAQRSLPTLVDFVDMDSAKWTQYAANHRWPLSWLYRREGARLLAFERATARAATRSYFVTDNECALFLQHAPECRGRVEAVNNGVDAGYFAPQMTLASPYGVGEIPLVFTGAMDYWPNVDAVSWFAAKVLPLLIAEYPSLRFYIVGRSPTAAVTALASEAVVVTGTVADVRPYLQHAAVVVAPLRIARGIQNKVLEAMAMARPVIASTECAGAIDARIGAEFLSAASAADYLAHIRRLLSDSAEAAAIGQAARARVLERYSWEAHMSALDALLPTPEVAPA